MTKDDKNKNQDSQFNIDRVSAARDVNMAGRDNNISNTSQSQNDVISNLFKDVYEKVEELPVRDQKIVETFIDDIENTTRELQENQENLEAQSFLEQRLVNLYNMRNDIWSTPAKIE